MDFGHPSAGSKATPPTVHGNSDWVDTDLGHISRTARREFRPTDELSILEIELSCGEV